MIEVCERVPRTMLQRGLDAAARSCDPEQRLPDSVKRWLDLSAGSDEQRARSVLGGARFQEPRASMQAWRETLYVTVADGTAVTTGGPTALVPDFTLPASYMYVGRTLEYTLYGRLSTAITTPGAWTQTLKWGGSGGTTLASTGAWGPDPTAAATNLAWWMKYCVVCRSVGATGTFFTMGHGWYNDVDDGAAAIANLTAALNNQVLAFPDVPAAVSVDTTTAKAISPCITTTVSTGSITAHIGILEALT